MVDETRTLTSPIVVGVAGAGEGDSALLWAARTAARTGTSLVVVHASDPEAVASRMAGAEIMAVSAVLDAEEETQRELQGRIDALAQELGITARVEMVRGSPVSALLAHQDEAAVIVVGTGAKGAIEEFVLGSTSLGVTAHARCPVVVVNPGVDLDALTHGRIGVAVDGSADSRRAARAALALAHYTGARVTALNTWYLEVVNGFVVTEPDSQEWVQLETDRRELVEGVLAPLRETYPGVEVDVKIARGPVVMTLRDYSRECDVLVVGSRGLGGIRGRLLGSVSQRMMRTASCPVLVVRAG
ncbi:universal stress protein [Ornithinimicrobium sufpigmenti]|uniref:universal stress protein n=1 Tax=Ornithinimicrobium sufpigmenti TaxID=2508882 RepID=UPI0015E1879D|nr:MULTISPECIES: universal stress protein [unclassified Ornithinimicrobium]